MNNTIFYFFYNLSHQSKVFDMVIVFFAVYLPYAVVMLAGLFLFFHHEILQAENPFRVFVEKRREVLFVFFSSSCAWVLSYILKFVFHTPRPFLALSEVSALFPETGFAFPSGHATFFSALAFSIFFLHKRAGYVFIAFALFIGLARIMVGVHFPVDILGGFFLGFFVSYVFDYLFPVRGGR